MGLCNLVMPELRLFILGDDLESGFFFVLGCYDLPCLERQCTNVVVVGCEGPDTASEVLSTASEAPFVVNPG